MAGWTRFAAEVFRDPRKRRALIALASLISVSLMLRRGANKASAQAAVEKVSQAATVVREHVPFSEFLQKVEKGQISKVLLGKETLDFDVKAAEAGKQLFTKPIHIHPGIIDLLHSKAIPFDELNLTQAAAPPRSALRSMLVFLVPAAYFGLVGYALKVLYDQTSGGDVGQLNTSSNVATSSSPAIKRTSFSHVAGIGAAREVVEEVADILKNPERYARVGARLPTGILLMGPPGTGKTMLARAMANDCGLPFFFCSGSDFVEVYAGRGASRVRNLFAKAAKSAPCVVFIDEIDALGKARSGEISMNEEREQTLNQLLAAMDGFCSEKRIVVIAATNRYDVLDKALVRPGRFDRIVRVELPSQAGREEILKVHTAHMRLSADCDLALLATMTPDYTGAELAMLCNEAAIRAARDKREELLTDDFMFALQQHKSSTKKGQKLARSGSDFVNNIFQSIRQD